MTTDGRNKNTPPSLSEFHALLRRMAISKGMAIPETDEEFAVLENGIDTSELPKHDFAQVLELIETGKSPVSKIVEFPSADENVVEELSQAARNGTEIPADIKEKMDADRAASEKDELRE